MLHNSLTEFPKTFCASSRDNALFPNKTQLFRSLFIYMKKSMVINAFNTHIHIYIDIIQGKFSA